MGYAADILRDCEGVMAGGCESPCKSHSYCDCRYLAASFAQGERSRCLELIEKMHPELTDLIDAVRGEPEEERYP